MIINKHNMILNLNISYAGFKRENFFKKISIQNTKNLINMTQMCITVNFTFLSHNQ